MNNLPVSDVPQMAPSTSPATQPSAQHPQDSLGPLLASGGLLVSGPLALAWLLGGRNLTEKVLVEILSPVGIVWVLLGIQLVWSLRQGHFRMALLSLTTWGMITVFGNWWVANLLVSRLESDYQHLDPLSSSFSSFSSFSASPAPPAPPAVLDRLVVLGGGTMSRRSGQPQLSPAGDRIALAAQLYHAGKVRTIVCTGSNLFPVSKNSLHCRQEARQLLIRLGVPEEAIELVAGINTSQEIANLAVHLRQQGGMSERNGLLTSAWHLPRAMQLSEKQQLAMIPIPADFRSEAFRLHPNLLVPGGFELNTSRSVIKEYLARWLGR